MRMAKYVAKRILLMLFVLFVIITVCFMLVRILPRELPLDKNIRMVMEARFEALGYNKPLLTQYWIYWKNILTDFDFGTSWYIKFRQPAMELLLSRLAPTVLVNTYSLVFSIPIGIMLGIYAAIKKNKWQDSLISTGVMVFISVPSYIYAFLVQYFLYFKLGLFDKGSILSLNDAGGSYFTLAMFKSMLMPILALSFGEIAGLCRFTRAELTETLTSDYMLLARTKGLTRAQATARHALKNAFVPILPMIIGSFVSVMSGSMIIEQIFSIPGVGQLYIQSINLLDYDVFMTDSIFYTFVGLLAGILVDISYGFIDPRIRMGE